MSELVLRNARIVTRDESLLGSLRAEAGRVTDLASGSTTRAGIDCEGDWLVPGLVELHTDVLERHAFPRPGVRWPEEAAVVAYDAQLAAAGITTSFDSLAIGYVIDSGQRPRDPRGLAEAIRATQARGLLRAEHYLHLRCEVPGARALELFEGDDEAARAWLLREQPALGGLRPLELAKSDVGAEEVEHLIGRLEHGIPA